MPFEPLAPNGAKPKRLRGPAKRTGKPNGRPPKKTGIDEIARKQRIASIMAMRLQGKSLASIGEAQSPKITQQRVQQIIADELANVAAQSVEDLRKLESLRLDVIQIKVFQGALEGDLQSIDRVLSIMATRAKILGVNAAEKREEVGAAADAKTNLFSKLAHPMTEEIRIRALMLFLEKAKGLKT